VSGIPEDPQPNDAHYAVVIGINFYETLNSLSGAIHDAEAFYEWLHRSDGGGLTKSNIRRVPATVNPDGQRLTPDLVAIHRTLSDVNLEMRTRFNDDPGAYKRSRLYVFVAGHGMSAPGASAALFSTEAREGSWGSALDLQACAQWYSDHGPFAEVVLLADCCRTNYRQVNLSGLPFDLWEFDYGEQDRPRVLTAYATLPDQLSFEGDANQDEDRGYFSRALIEGLLEAVDPKEGCVTNLSLEKHVREKVEAMTAPPHPPPPQTSQMTGAYYPLICFGPTRNNHLHEVTIEVSKEKMALYGTLEILTSERVAIAECPSTLVDSKWVLKLPRGLYRCEWRRADGVVHKDSPLDVDDTDEVTG
jgi:Caspase domain